MSVPTCSSLSHIEHILIPKRTHSIVLAQCRTSMSVPTCSSLSHILSFFFFCNPSLSTESSVNVYPCVSMSVNVCLCLSMSVCLPVHCLPASPLSACLRICSASLKDEGDSARVNYPRSPPTSQYCHFLGNFDRGCECVCVCVCVCKQPVVRTNRFFTLIRSIRFSTNSFSLISSLLFSMRSHTQRTNPFSTSGQPL